MARLTLAFKIAAITLIVWKKGVRFDLAEEDAYGFKPYRYWESADRIESPK
jgi:hypothetical protein